VPDKPVYAGRHHPLIPVLLDPYQGRQERVIGIGAEEQEEARAVCAGDSAFYSDCRSVKRDDSDNG